MESFSIQTPSQLYEFDHMIWDAFFSKEVTLYHPTQEIFDTLSRARDKGINVYDAHLLPEIDLSEVKEAPGWLKTLPEWVYDEVKAGRISSEALKLTGNAVLFEKTPKPPYQDGLQLYPADPFARILEEGRDQGAIEVVDYTKDIPRNSRFGLAPNELGYVNSKIAELLVVDGSQARQPKAIENNLLGNAFYPYLGLTGVSEWYEDEIKYADGHVHRLFGGGSGPGGLSGVYYWPLYARSRDVGFRSLVE